MNRCDWKKVNQSKIKAILCSFPIKFLNCLDMCDLYKTLSMIKAPAKRSQHGWVQHCLHITCVWLPCCDMLGVVASSFKMVKFKQTTPNTSQHGTTGKTNMCNMLRPKILRYVELTYSDCLAGALREVTMKLTEALFNKQIICHSIGWHFLFHQFPVSWCQHIFSLDGFG